KTGSQDYSGMGRASRLENLYKSGLERIMPESNLSRIYFLSEFNRKEARHQYLEAFKVSPEDRSIDDELEALFRDQDCEFDKTEMLIPARIVLGLILRPRGQGRGRARPEKEKWARRRADL